MREALDDILRSIVQSDPEDYGDAELAYIEKQGFESAKRPLIYISMGTAGIVAGSRILYKMLAEYLVERNIKARLIPVGSLGFDAAEPILGVKLPGKSTLYLRNVNEENLVSLLDDVLHDNIPETNILAQKKEKDSGKWEGVPDFEDIDFFRFQTRLILRDCGFLNPESVNDYIMRGGYRAFLKTINNYTYPEICELLIESGLRGRSGSGFSTGEKLKIAFNSPADTKYLVCNAEESDPGAFMDRALMERNPHQLLEGI